MRRVEDNRDLVVVHGVQRVSDGGWGKVTCGGWWRRKEPEAGYPLKLYYTVRTLLGFSFIYWGGGGGVGMGVGGEIWRD